MLLLLACAAPDVGPIEDALGEAGPIAFAGMQALSAVRGDGGACAVVTPGCDGLPCTTTVQIVLGDTCPLPVAEAATGGIEVAATFDEDGAGALAADFSGVDADGQALRVADVAAFAVTGGDDETPTVTWFQQDVNLASGAAPSASDPVGQAAWVTRVDDAGTPDPSDDTYTIDGGAEIATDAGGAIASLVEATFTPDCRRNPTAGGATIEWGDDGDGEIDSYVFTDACDGGMVLAAGLGTASAARTGQGVPISLVQ